MELCALCHTWHRPDDCLLNPRRDWVLRGPSVLPHKPNGKTTWDHSQPEPEAEPKHISSKPPELTAYMLPDGIYAVVWCAHCRLWHRHGEAIGDYRQAHCRTTASPYVGHGPGSGYKLIGGEPAPAWVLEDLRRERPNGPTNAATDSLLSTPTEDHGWKSRAQTNKDRALRCNLGEPAIFTRLLSRDVRVRSRIGLLLGGR
jgi:hypothetical protein